MATFDLEEQEKLDDLKAWWKQYGKVVVGAVLACVLAIAGWQGWQSWQAKQRAEAAMLFGMLQQAGEQNDSKQMRELGGKLIESYASTPYAARAAMLVARSNHAAGDDKSAQAQLQWVLDHSDDAALLDLARLDLAAVMIDGKQAEAALKLLDTAHAEALAGLYLDRKGDALVALGKNAEAVTAYANALKKLDANHPYARVIQLKRDMLGAKA